MKTEQELINIFKLRPDTYLYMINNVMEDAWSDALILLLRDKIKRDIENKED